MKRDQLPGGLPPGRLITPEPAHAVRAGVAPVTEPVLWVCDEPLDEAEAGHRWADLLGRHRTTGLWPLLLGAVSAVPPFAPWHSGDLIPMPTGLADEKDAEGELADGWGRLTRSYAGLPDGDEEPSVDFGWTGLGWPGLAPDGEPSRDPDRHAAALVTDPSLPAASVSAPFHGAPDAGPGAAALRGGGWGPFLGLVAAPSGADAVIASGWQAPAGAAECTVVLRSWQRRFGVRLCGLGSDDLYVTVARPPRTAEHARRVAVEHFAFCPDLAGEIGFDAYASSLVDAVVWSFWWD